MKRNQIICLVWGLLVCLGACIQGGPTMDETELKRNLLAAEREQIAPDQIASYILQAPTLETRNALDRYRLIQADLQADPATADELPPLAQARHVAYWKWAETPAYVMVSGLYWPREGPPTVFHARIEAP